MYMTFCSRCGRRLVPPESEGRKRPVCPQDADGCGFVDFGRYILVVRGLILQPDAQGESQILLVRPYGDEDWWLPGGHVDSEETAERAVVREVQEETGLQCTVVGLAGFRNRLAADGNLSTAFFLLRHVKGDLNPGPADEYVEARFFSLEDIQTVPVLPLIRPLVSAALKGRLRVFPGTAVPGYTSLAAGEDVPAVTLFMG